MSSFNLGDSVKVKSGDAVYRWLTDECFITEVKENGTYRVQWSDGDSVVVSGSALVKV